MLEILFVLGFFFMLLLTGISLLGMLAALVVAFAVIKMLPWLILAVAIVWIYRAVKHPEKPRDRRRRYPRI
jgi:phage shock protein G